MLKLFDSLTTQFPTLTIRQNEPLSAHTTLKIGGPADLYIETKTNSELVQLLQFLRSNLPRPSFDKEGVVKLKSPLSKGDLEGLKIHLLGNGSNVLISDSGLRGIVIRNLSNNINIQTSDQKETSADVSHLKSISTHRTENEPQKYLNFQSLDYDESTSPTIDVTFDAGVPLPLAINYSLDHTVTGLQWFAYIPGTIGGATWYNIHGGSYHLSDYIQSVEVFDLSSGKINKIDFNNNLMTEKDEVDVFAGTQRMRSPASPKVASTAKNINESLRFDYEKSPFQSNPNLVILSTTLRLFQGDVNRAKAVRDAWIAQKSKVQPMNSAGSIFQNPSLADCTRLWGEQKSTGWIIDHELGWKGKQLGGAQISLQHANFIVNTGKATAADYYALAQSVISEVKSRFNLDLKMEVKLLGNFS